MLDGGTLRKLYASTMAAGANTPHAIDINHPWTWYMNKMLSGGLPHFEQGPGAAQSCLLNTARHSMERSAIMTRF